MLSFVSFLSLGWFSLELAAFLGIFIDHMIVLTLSANESG